jgi:dTDP-4-dehydrorhamnose reductase
MQLMRRQAPYGIYNVTNPGSITTREVVELIKTYLGIDKQFNFFTDYNSFNSSVKTGRSNCTLSTDKLTTYVGIRTAEEALIDAIVNYR